MSQDSGAWKKEQDKKADAARNPGAGMFDISDKISTNYDVVIDKFDDMGMLFSL